MCVLNITHASCHPLFIPIDLPATPLCAAGAVESINHMQCHPTSPSKIKSHEPWLKGTYRTEKVSEDGAFRIRDRSGRCPNRMDPRQQHLCCTAAAAAAIRLCGNQHTIRAAASACLTSPLTLLALVLLSVHGPRPALCLRNDHHHHGAFLPPICTTLPTATLLLSPHRAASSPVWTCAPRWTACTMRLRARRTSPRGRPRWHPEP